MDIAAHPVLFYEAASKVPGIRPDGLVRIENGGKVWLAIIEAKAGSAKLDTEQVDKYVDAARAYGVDAVITISNELSTRTDHHPVTINAQKLRKVSLLHWSCAAVETQAIIHISNAQIADPDQAYILSEFVRFLEHPKSGVRAVSAMPTIWKTVCADIRSTGQCAKNTAGVADIVDAWQQLTRAIALKLSAEISARVDIHLPRAHEADPKFRTAHDTNLLCGEGRFEDSFDVPDAADRVRLVADVTARSLTASMTLSAPKDKSRASASITWIRKQLSKCEDPSAVQLIVKWLGRTPDSPPITIADLELNPDAPLLEDRSIMPRAFEIRISRDLKGGFDQPQKFVAAALEILPDYYNLSGQHLRKWVAAPPKAKAASEKKTPADIVDATKPALSE